jgi:hypothetical protein
LTITSSATPSLSPLPLLMLSLPKLRPLPRRSMRSLPFVKSAILSAPHLPLKQKVSTSLPPLRVSLPLPP